MLIFYNLIVWDSLTHLYSDRHAVNADACAGFYVCRHCTWWHLTERNCFCPCLSLKTVVLFVLLTKSQTYKSLNLSYWSVWQDCWNVKPPFNHPSVSPFSESRARWGETTTWATEEMGMEQSLTVKRHHGVQSLQDVSFLELYSPPGRLFPHV